MKHNSYKFVFFICFFSSFIYAQEFPLVIVTCSYNNALYVAQNLDSIFNQNYHNFRLIYIDDCSTDDTTQLVENYIEEHNVQDKVTLIKNSIHQGKGANIYNACHSCNDLEIIVILDGDDWLAHENALADINTAYLKTNAWCAYSHSKTYPQGVLSNAHALPFNVIEERSFRKYTWMYAAPRSFYAWIFKLIKLEDQLTKNVPGFEGKFFPNYNDRAIMYPILEMATNHIAFVPEITSIQNCENPISSQFVSSTFTDVQWHCHIETVHSPIIYEQISIPIVNRLDVYKKSCADCLVLIENLTNAIPILHTIENYVQNIGNIILVSDSPKQLDLIVKDLHINHKIKVATTADLSHICFNQHILLMHDKVSLREIINCNTIIKELERTFAYAWYCTLSLEICAQYQIPIQQIENDVYAWRFFCDKLNAISIYNFNATLYRTSDVNELINTKTSSIKQLKEILQRKQFDTNKIGLFKSTVCKGL